jgi:hypothetical protein
VDLWNSGISTKYLVEMMQEPIEAQVVALCCCTRNGARITCITVSAAFHKNSEEQQHSNFSSVLQSRKQPAHHDFISWLITAMLNEDTLYDDTV